jgi:hypothetical protein
MKQESSYLNLLFAGLLLLGCGTLAVAQDRRDKVPLIPTTPK